VPQYNPERGVVGKCDMCHGRLGLGQAPACVSACPSGAIQIEIVNVKTWRTAAAASASRTGFPSGDQSVSTTRITMPERLAPNAKPVDLVHVKPGAPHWPLVVMTVFTQLSVGAFAAIWTLQLAGASTGLGAAAWTSLLVAMLALTASTLHLGRPIYAYRALKMWRRSWLSREVALFAGFSAVACVYAASLWMQWSAGPVLGGVTFLLGFGGVTASACIYRVPSRPAWNTSLTLVQFNLTALTLGPLFAAATGAGTSRWLAVTCAAMAGAQFVVLALKLFRLSGADTVELQASSRLLATTLRRPFIARGVLLALGAIALPLFTSNAMILWAACGLALAGEVVGRYLFFVSAVPKHPAAPYFGSEAA
jgi:DMSO reductase anchor subunit